MVWLGFQYALRERKRFFVALTGVTSAVVLTLFLVGIYQGALHGSLSYVEQAEADIWVGRKGSWNLMRSSGLLPGSVRRTLLEIPGVTRVEPILAALMPAEIAGEPRTLLVIGLAPDATAATPRRVLSGQPLPRTGQVVVDRAFARKSGLCLGDSLTLGGRRLRIAGISADTNLLVTQYAFVSASDLDRLLGLADHSSFLLVQTSPGCTPRVLDQIRYELPQVEAYEAGVFLANNHREITSGFLPVLLAVAILGTIVGALVVALNMYVNVLEKRSEFALLAALGGSQRTRALIVLQQAVSVAAAGAFTGLLILAVLERLLPLAVPEVEFHLSPALATATFVGVLGLAFAGALVPARLAARIPPMEALRR